MFIVLQFIFILENDTHLRTDEYISILIKQHCESDNRSDVRQDFSNV
jgi:hypothetical protein